MPKENEIVGLKIGAKHFGSELLGEHVESEFSDVLRERSEEFARQKKEVGTNTEEQYIRFRLGAHELYGIAYDYVDEILNPLEICPVPCTPAHIAGLINRRSELLPVIDLKAFFKLNAAQSSEKIWVIIVRHNGLSVGVVCDEVLGNATYQVDDISPAIASGGVKNLDYIKGIIKGELTLLDIEALFSDKAILVNERVT